MTKAEKTICKASQLANLKIDPLILISDCHRILLDNFLGEHGADRQQWLDELNSLEALASKTEPASLQGAVSWLGILAESGNYSLPTENEIGSLIHIHRFLTPIADRADS